MILQAARQDLALAEAVSVRFKPGSALGQARAAAEEEYAEALVSIADTYNSTLASIIAAETYMNLSPWDYYQQVTSLAAGSLPSRHAVKCIAARFDLASRRLASPSFARSNHCISMITVLRWQCLL